MQPKYTDGDGNGKLYRVYCRFYEQKPVILRRYQARYGKALWRSCSDRTQPSKQDTALAHATDGKSKPNPERAATTRFLSLEHINFITRLVAYGQAQTAAGAQD